jgi:putative GTP pyrophosphokinase
MNNFMQEQLQKQLLHEYNAMEPVYRDFAATNKGLIANILTRKELQLHSVTHRHKSNASLKAKLARPDCNYQALTDITDLSAVRVTTYFADDVDIVSSIIEKEFAIDVKNSVDKRALLDPDRFGYVSVHYVAELSPARIALPEYQKFSALKVEIQIRSILQHAWAEIEHDLGYKSKHAIPSAVQRQFARLASLFELADIEFSSIRRTLLAYEESVPGEIKLQPDKVSLDLVSLRSFLSTSDEAKRIDKEIIGLLGGRSIKNDDTYVDQMIARLDWFGVRTIGQLETCLKSNSEVIRKFAWFWTVGRAPKPKKSVSKPELVPDGVCIFYLCYVMSAANGSDERINEYLKKFLNAIDHRTVKNVRDAYQHAIK